MKMKYKCKANCTLMIFLCYVCIFWYFFVFYFFFFFQAEDGIRDDLVTGVQTCALPISTSPGSAGMSPARARCCARAMAALTSGRPRRRSAETIQIGRASCRERV